MFLIAVAVSLLSCVFGQQTEGGANVIFARPFSSNTSLSLSDENSGQSYEKAHLVFVTEFNRGIRSSTFVPETTDEKETFITSCSSFLISNVLFRQFASTRRCHALNVRQTIRVLDKPISGKGILVKWGKLTPVCKCDCPLDKKCTYHRENMNLKMFVFLCYPLTPTTTTNSTLAV
ncbi:UNVERIFIED_CONTAM: hypothetical protein NCL1_26470 [Trichonephila clavipes]